MKHILAWSLQRPTSSHRPAESVDIYLAFYQQSQTCSTQPVLGSITLIFLSLQVVANKLPSKFHDIEYIVLL